MFQNELLIGQGRNSKGDDDFKDLQGRVMAVSSVERARLGVGACECPCYPCRLMQRGGGGAGLTRWVLSIAVRVSLARITLVRGVRLVYKGMLGVLMGDVGGMVVVVRDLLLVHPTAPASCYRPSCNQLKFLQRLLVCEVVRTSVTFSTCSSICRRSSYLRKTFDT